MSLLEPKNSPENTAPQTEDAPAVLTQTEDQAVEALRENLKNRLVQKLPGSLQDRIDANMPAAQKLLESTKEFLGPLWAELRILTQGAAKKLAASAPTATVGGTFRHLCFVGLNRAELLLSGETQPVFNDSWADLAGDNIKRHTALLFFAPRGLDGKPVNPYLFLAGEGVPDEEDMADPNAVALAQQAVGPLALLDLCRLSPSAPNTVNILVVADTLFHWDVKDNYVLPTTPTSWVRDVEQVLKSYPRTTRANIYTQWETDLLPPNERVSVHNLREFPLDDNTWLNKPTLQERYGNHMLFIGLLLAGLTYAGLWYQGQELSDLSDQLNMIEQQIPRGGQFSDLERAITEQEKMWQKRELFSLVVKDIARSIQNSGLQASSFEIRTPEPETPPSQYVVTIDAKSDVYQGWLQQEPIARALILNSATLDAIRKPPTSSGFKLEAIVNANTLAREFKPFASQLNKTALQSSPTAPASATAPVQQGQANGGKQGEGN
ncbi:MAG: hypothetical protein DI585_07250 [Pseudomonas fluorescens]|nr:MAG: hypothetical protein DI585_07250 [Pseudomonas fluorescens]